MVLWAEEPFELFGDIRILWTLELMVYAVLFQGSQSCSQHIKLSLYSTSAGPQSAIRAPPELSHTYCKSGTRHFESLSLFEGQVIVVC